MDFQLKLIALVMVYVETRAGGNVPVYCNKARGIDKQNHTVSGVKQYITSLNLEQSRTQRLSSHENESYHTVTPVLLQMIKTSELTEQWQPMLYGDAAP